MQIVFDKTIVAELRERYTVLELETFDVQGTALTAFCVVPAEKLAFTDLNTLEDQIENHNAFLTALNNKQWEFIVKSYDTLHGQFGGELDSFYSDILDRAKSNLGK
jgi:hypothetical protein